MAQQTNATPAQIDKELVARTIGQVGDRRSAQTDAPEMRYWNIAAYNTYDDVHRALLIDTQNPDQLYYAWTNDERTTWKVESAGEALVVEDVELETPDEVDDDVTYVEEWAEILLDELRYDAENRAQSRSVSDEIEFVGSKTLRFRDVDGRIATFNIDLE